jgi:ribonuclease BN (tRNA processing enzyme)
LFEILFLGTSASAPSAKRGLSAQIVSHNEYRFLIDCGEGTQRQILQSGIGFKRLTRVLLTHGHLDHAGKQLRNWKSTAGGKRSTASTICCMVLFCAAISRPCLCG